jgi:NAD-dependent dihydropyrimidine dehydrogenase PreA subunit
MRVEDPDSVAAYFTDGVLCGENKTCCLPACASLPVVLERGSDESAEETRARVEALLENGYGLTVLPPGRKSSESSDGPVCVVGPAEGDVVAKVRTELGPSSSGAWMPWYPLIDEERCTNCKQCLSFCLFGVFRESPDGRVEVIHPENCKNKCPACARVCPEMAIIFPKYKAGPLSGGEGGGDGESMQVDVASLVGDDLYGTLRARSCGDRSCGERDKDRALAERKRCACMSDLQKKLDIPAEVLASLTGGPPPRAPDKPEAEPEGEPCE